MERKVQIIKQKEQRKKSRSREEESKSDQTDDPDFTLLESQPNGFKLLTILRRKSLKFQGAAQFKVFHGTVTILGSIFNPDGQWHQVISDPRKNMLLDIKNISQENSVANLEITLDDDSKFPVKSIPKKCALIGIKEYTDYTEAENQFLIAQEEAFQIKNFSTQISSKKGFFALNNSWQDNIDVLIKSISKNHIFLVNGVVNAGKSTFISCLINQVLSRTESDVYVLDLDPGQPNYNLAGQLCLSKMGEKILTNSDFHNVEIVSAYYLNTPTPNLNMKYYNSCVKKLMEDYYAIKSEKRQVLIVNTCGWVEGLGVEIQMQVVENVKPDIILTMTKYNQGLKGNEFSKLCRSKNGSLIYLDVENDQYEGTMNVKGAVQRNRKIVNALSQSENDKYLFNQNQVEGSNQLPLKFQDKTIKRNEFSISKSQAFKIHTKPFQTVAFKKAAFCLIKEQLEEVSNKIDTLRFFNCEVIAALKIDNAQFKSLRQFDDLRIIEIPFTNYNLPPIKILFYGLIRDIDYGEGVKIIPQNDIDIGDLDFNAICLAHDSIFKFPSSYLMQDDVQEHLLRKEVDNSAQRQVFYNKQQSEQNVKHFMSDLHKQQQ